MKSKGHIQNLVLGVLLLVGLILHGQSCPDLTSPVDGATNVPVNADISWSAVEGINGYILSIGTTPGGTEILNERPVGSATTYTPPLGLPENTQIYVTITLFFFDRPDITCNTETFRTEDITTAPLCTSLRNPLNNATDVNVGTNIVWNYAPTATDYRLNIGTTPGGNDILNDQSVGNVLSYQPPADFPPNTQIYVTVVPVNDNGSPAPCQEESFTTGDIAVLPGCTSLISPADGAINVPLTPFLEWTAVPGADGYRLTIGESPFTAEILDNNEFLTNSTFVINFDPNKTFFITIVPFNDAGEAIGCQQESFTTILGCGPFIDRDTGELVTLNPEIEFPDTVSFCENTTPLVITSPDVADGFRWYKVDEFGNEILISSTAEVSISENGEYIYEAYNEIPQATGVVECATTKTFNVVSSELATVRNVDIREVGNGLRIQVEVDGIGDYEFAIDNPEGPYQIDNVFEGISPGTHIIYIRDRNGCGTVDYEITQDLTLEGFPKFFTPNGDGINDFWQFVPPVAGEVNVADIFIFDRFGRLITQMDPLSQGWDGTFNGTELPSADYWFKARDASDNEITGHFALKR
ncbi:T9SS type B sorting domain-containing protein [Poritiphilus flavus]|uniref:T9SS type B sorting domain-containing protein n=1 Tax=Poritiphilus flavus TaxID=2697053 RepID=A0A6L9E9M1_9FLAO|nr:T9SS type B sorting domain-containing protein [Poritiphilus flavus]NAS11262.1 T9SS type B sorting domain-containing protein [Poritiphilus flavus]